MLKVMYYRKKKGLSQKELAQMIGMTDQTISNIERGINYGTIETLIKIAKALDVSIKDLFEE